MKEMLLVDFLLFFGFVLVVACIFGWIGWIFLVSQADRVKISLDFLPKKGEADGSS